MLVLLEKIASVMSRIKSLIQLCFLLALTGTAWLLAAAPVAMQDQWLIPGIVLTMWLLMAMSITVLFRQPAQVNGEPEGSWHHTKAKMGRWLMQVLAWIVIGICLALVIISLQLAMNWFRYH